MSNFGKRIDGPAGRRWLKRRRVGISALAELVDRTSGVLIQDLSLTGARLLGGDLPLPRARVTLKVRERELAGDIVWAEGDHRGICFDFARR
jgi:hypothetical protein